MTKCCCCEKVLGPEDKHWHDEFMGIDHCEDCVENGSPPPELWHRTLGAFAAVCRILALRMSLEKTRLEKTRLERERLEKKKR